MKNLVVFSLVGFCSLAVGCGGSTKKSPPPAAESAPAAEAPAPAEETPPAEAPAVEGAEPKADVEAAMLTQLVGVLCNPSSPPMSCFEIDEPTCKTTVEKTLDACWDSMAKDAPDPMPPETAKKLGTDVGTCVGTGFNEGLRSVGLFAGGPGC